MRLVILFYTFVPRMYLKKKKKRVFHQNSELQAACDTSIARVTVFVYPPIITCVSSSGCTFSLLKIKFLYSCCLIVKGMQLVD